ncbi:hypothetical protein CPC08DRAFT_824047 [Agrocybe pediades]|nr:hypothetical protein CPC08DRAFT_824047 [Agrocybe pediades]
MSFFNDCDYNFDAFPFALAPKSIRLRRDLFIFEEPASGRLLGGLNQTVTHASPHQLRRWLLLLFPEATEPAHYLVSIMVKRSTIFFYNRERKGELLSWESRSPLLPGCYALVVEDGVTPNLLAFRGDDPVDTYAERAEKVETFPTRYPADYVNKVMKYNRYKDEELNFLRLVPSRDGCRCLITNLPLADADVGISWIIPPAFTDQEDYEPLFHCQPENSRIYANCITMHKLLVTPFLRNAFGVEVVDDYNIVVFEDLGEAATELLNKANFKATKLKEAVNKGGPNSPSADFLMGHFRHCLRSVFLGGEITMEEDYSPSTCQYILRKANRVRKNPQDPFWKTLAGKEARAYMIGDGQRWGSEL